MRKTSYFITGMVLGSVITSDILDHDPFDIVDAAKHKISKLKKKKHHHKDENKKED